MVRLKECNEQIKYLQKRLTQTISLTERVSLEDTLAFYLDMRATLMMKELKYKDE